jgi:magnesium and cobalt transporter
MPLLKWVKSYASRKKVMRERVLAFIQDQNTKDDTIAPHDIQLVSNILTVRQITVEDIMMPHTAVVAVSLTTPVNEVVRIMIQSGHSRLPVYRQTLDDVLGFVHIKDIIPYWQKDKTPPLQKILRPIVFVSPSIRALDLLSKMRVSGAQMALVVDEFGGVDGLVTIGDLLELIVGKIENDNGEDDPINLKKIGHDVYITDARIRLDMVESQLNVAFTDHHKQETDTLGGLVFMLLGEVPKRGASVEYGPLHIEVIEADMRRVKRLLIKRNDEND